MYKQNLSAVTDVNIIEDQKTISDKKMDYIHVICHALHASLSCYSKYIFLNLRMNCTTAIRVCDSRKKKVLQLSVHRRLKSLMMKPGGEIVRYTVLC